MHIIVRQSSAYSLDYIKDKCQRHLREPFRYKWPLETVHNRYRGKDRKERHKADEEKLRRFKNRPEREPWPWEQEHSDGEA